MPLDSDYPDCVAFVMTERVQGDSTRGLTAIGTAFLVGMPFGDGTKRTFTYAVTAGHVVTRPVEYFLRVNTLRGVQDVAVSEWIRHPTQDVAVASVVLGVDWRYALVPTEMFVGDAVCPARAETGRQSVFHRAAHLPSGLTR